MCEGEGAGAGVPGALVQIACECGEQGDAFVRGCGPFQFTGERFVELSQVVFDDSFGEHLEVGDGVAGALEGAGAALGLDVAGFLVDSGVAAASGGEVPLGRGAEGHVVGYFAPQGDSAGQDEFDRELPGVFAKAGFDRGPGAGCRAEDEPAVPLPACGQDEVQRGRVRRGGG